MYDESAMETYTTPSGLKRYRLPVENTQLNKHRFISSDIPEFAIHKAALQEMLWSIQWKERSAIKHKKLGLEMNSKRVDLKLRQKHKIAEGRTEIAQYELSCAYGILAAGLNSSLDYSWDFFTKCPEYPFPRPLPPDYPAPPPRPGLPREPEATDPDYQPKLESINKLLRFRRVQKAHEAHAHFEKDHRSWEKQCLQLRQRYQEQISNYRETVNALKNNYQKQVDAWQNNKEAYTARRNACVRLVAQKKAAYLEHEPHAVIDYFDMSLARSKYPLCFPQSYEMDYDASNRVLTIDYLLPSLRVLPRLSRVVYNEAQGQFHDIILTENERNILYARLLHEVPLRIFYEAFNLDVAVSLSAINFRGYIFLHEEKNSGKPPRRVVEIQTDRATLAATDLYHGDPAVIFQEMGGIIRSQY